MIVAEVRGDVQFARGQSSGGRSGLTPRSCPSNNTEYRSIHDSIVELPGIKDKDKK